MDILSNLLLLVVGTALLIGAAKFLLDGLLGLAARLAVPAFILAMIVISIDLEEFAPAVAGSYHNLTALSYGSVIGTVIFLICLAMGIAAIIYPIKDINFPVRYVLLLGAALAISTLFALDNTVSSTEGVICVLLYGAYIVYLIQDLRNTRTLRSDIQEAQEELEEIVGKSSLRYAIYIVVGLVCLIIGGLITVRGISNMLGIWGISETILGATLLAIAANSVELVEAIVPARRGLSEIVIGNVVGSSIFQVLFTVGVAAIVRPLVIEPIVFLSWAFLLVITLQKRLTRPSALGLLTFYGLFLIASVAYLS